MTLAVGMTRAMIGIPMMVGAPLVTLFVATVVPVAIIMVAAMAAIVVTLVVTRIAMMPVIRCS